MDVIHEILNKVIDVKAGAFERRPRQLQRQLGYFFRHWCRYVAAGQNQLLDSLSQLMEKCKGLPVLPVRFSDYAVRVMDHFGLAVLAGTSQSSYFQRWRAFKGSC